MLWKSWSRSCTCVLRQWRLIKGLFGTQSSSNHGISPPQACSYSTKSSLTSCKLREKEAEQFLANLDEKQLLKMKEIKQYKDYLAAMNMPVPQELFPSHWKRLITEYDSATSRKKFLAFLARREFQRHQKLLLDKEKTKTDNILDSEFEEGHPVPKIFSYKRTRKFQLDDWCSLQAFKSDIPIVIDVDFDMSAQEQINALRQFLLIWGRNRIHPQPLQVHFTSILKNNELRYTVEANQGGPVFYHHEHFLDIFPPKNLVYLTPDGYPLKDIDSNSIYIIGGLVDKELKKRITVSKARHLGIQYASLPIKRYCRPVQGEKPAKRVLTTSCCFDIMQDMYLHKSWELAFRTHLSSRRFTVDGGSTKEEEGMGTLNVLGNSD